MIGNAGKEQHLMTEVEEQEQKLVYLNIFLLNYIFVMFKFCFISVY